MAPRSQRRECCEYTYLARSASSTDSLQLVSVISLLSVDHPDLNSPANVDAAKQVREDYEGRCFIVATGKAELTGRIQEEGQEAGSQVGGGGLGLT